MGKCFPRADVLGRLIHPPLPQGPEACLLSSLRVLLLSSLFLFSVDAHEPFLGSVSHLRHCFLQLRESCLLP